MIQQYSRREKVKIFLKTFKPRGTEKLLVLGCGDHGALKDYYHLFGSVTCIDIQDCALQAQPKDVKTLKLDLNKPLPFKDKEFDIAFSNAVIEHLREQRLFAMEVMRVAKTYFIATPNKLFPFEMHYRLPLFQWLPKEAQRWLAMRFALGNYPRGYYEKIRLLTPRQMELLFPYARIQVHDLYNLIAIKNEPLPIERGDALSEI